MCDSRRRNKQQGNEVYASWGTRGSVMADYESPSARYRRLAAECLEVGSTFPLGERRTVLLQMAQVWQRLADDYQGSTPPLIRVRSVARSSFANALSWPALELGDDRQLLFNICPRPSAMCRSAIFNSRFN